MVIWSNPAKDDLKKIHDYIAKDSKFYAIKVSQEFIEESENLKEFPKMGRVVPELGYSNIRELFLYSYRLIYEISPDKVEILAIIHGRKDFYSALEKRKK
ncbi:MAG: type II toxin-antitoxin system RelE/ParE family toxin [Calditrichales bacterium]|nr:type II toxin-antitoxin system RelE/ParE family toxin [Calditrichales bacterium]